MHIAWLHGQNYVIEQETLITTHNHHKKWSGHFPLVVYNKFYHLKKIVIAKIQNGHVRDYMGKENIAISLMDWKIIVFDHKGVKIVKVIWSLSILF